MEKSNKRPILAGLLGTLAMLVFTAATGPFVMAAGKSESDSGWIWTQERPQPSYWRWDESYFKEKPVRGGVYQESWGMDLGVMNPNHWPVNNWNVIGLLHDRLLHTDGRYQPIIPWLATTWKYEGPLTVLMKLRRGVKFTDGALFNAHAVQYQMNWIMDKKNGAWSRTYLEPLASVEVVDDYTIRWHLKRKWSSFFNVLTSIPGWMISPQALKGDVALVDLDRLEDRMDMAEEEMDEAEGAVAIKRAKAKFAEATRRFEEAERQAEGIVSLDIMAVTSGPYMVEENRPGNYVKLKRNPNWWFGRSIGKPDMPYFDGRKITIIPEPSVRLANLKAGKLDTLLIENSQYAQVKDDPKLNNAVLPGNFTWIMLLNHSKGPLKDIRVRKAISHAIDRKALIAASGAGFGAVAACQFPTRHWARNPKLKPVAYDPELSRKLLAAAGYANGLNLRGTSYPDEALTRFSQIIQAMMKMVNINYQVDYLDPAAASERFRNNEYDMNAWLHQFISDPNGISQHYLPENSLNLGRSRNEKVIALVKAAQTELNFEKRKQLYHDLETALYNDYEDVWLFHPTFIWATRKVVRGENYRMMFGADGTGGPGWGLGNTIHPTWFKNGKRY